jgi:hypothetical protein
MKTANILRILTAISAGATSLAAFDLGGVLHLVPGKYAVILGGLTLALKASKEVAVVVGDYLDDGKRNGSFNCAPLAFIAAGLIAVLGMTSCVTTTAPDGTKTEKTDAEAVTLFGGFALKFAELFKPAPVAVPVAPSAK